MNIAIVGAGIAGVSTALELISDGHQVTIFEQLNASAEGSSFAPGGWLSPCDLHALCTPGQGMPWQQMRRSIHTLQGNTLIGSTAWRWLRQWKLREKLAHQQGHSLHHTALQALSCYSTHLRSAYSLTQSPALDLEIRNGHLILFRQQKDYDFWAEQLPKLQEYMPCSLWSMEQCQQQEPALHIATSAAGALYFPSGQTINPRLWTQQLRQHALAQGVRIHTGHKVSAIQPHTVSLCIDNKTLQCDHIILCTGSSLELLQQLNLYLPTLPVAGYSITTPIRDALLAPRNSLMDWSHQAIISRLEQRVRITAGTELNQTASTPHQEPTLRRMYNLLNDWFPGGLQLASTQAQVWKGSRLYLPDGLPALGPTQHPHIWLNTAHGQHGFALANGCARALADMISSRVPAIDTQAFAPQRFART